MIFISWDVSPFEQIYWMDQFGIEYEEFVPYEKRQVIHKFFYIVEWIGVNYSYPFVEGTEGPFSPKLAEDLPYLHTIRKYHLEDLELNITEAQLSHLILPPENIDMDKWIRVFGAFLFFYERCNLGVEETLRTIQQKISLDDWDSAEKALKNRLFYIRMKA